MATRKQRDRRTDDKRRFNYASARAFLRGRSGVRILARGQRGWRSLYAARKPKRPAKGQLGRRRKQYFAGRHPYRFVRCDATLEIGRGTCEISGK